MKTITVKELIVYLKQFHSDMPVMFRDSINETCEDISLEYDTTPKCLQDIFYKAILYDFGEGIRDAYPFEDATLDDFDEETIAIAEVVVLNQ